MRDFLTNFLFEPQWNLVEGSGWLEGGSERGARYKGFVRKSFMAGWRKLLKELLGKEDN